MWLLSAVETEKQRKRFDFAASFDNSFHFVSIDAQWNCLNRCLFTFVLILSFDCHNKDVFTRVTFKCERKWLSHSITFLKNSFPRTKHIWLLRFLGRFYWFSSNVQILFVLVVVVVVVLRRPCVHSTLLPICPYVPAVLDTWFGRKEKIREESLLLMY